MKPQNIAQLTLKELKLQLKAEYKRSFRGCTRRTYIDHKEKIVFKLPISLEWHSRYNEAEYQNYIKYKNNQPGIEYTDFIIPIAYTERHYTRDNICILVMEKVIILKKDWSKRHIWINDYPEWTKYIDSFQVGWDSRQQLVAYDHTYPY